MRKSGYRIMASVLTAFLFLGQPFSALAKEPEEKPYVDGEIIAVYDDADLSEKATEEKKEKIEESLLKKLDIEEIVEVFDATKEHGSMVVLELPDELSVKEAVKKVRKLEGISYAQPNYQYSLLDEIAEESVDISELTSKEENARYLKDLHVTEARELMETDKEQTVAVFDTGCSESHHALKSVVDSEHAYDVYRQMALFEDSSKESDSNGHGTYECGLIAGVSQEKAGMSGISANTKVLPVQVFDDYSNSCSTVELLQACEYIKGLRSEKKLDQLHVILMNFATSSGKDQLFHEELKLLREDYDIIAVCAGEAEDTEKLYPADWGECISVGVLDDLAVCSTYSESDDSYAYMSGVSAATPMVAGLCSMLWAIDPNASADLIEDTLMQGNEQIIKNLNAENVIKSFQAKLEEK